MNIIEIQNCLLCNSPLIEHIDYDSESDGYVALFCDTSALMSNSHFILKYKKHRDIIRYNITYVIDKYLIHFYEDNSMVLYCNNKRVGIYGKCFAAKDLTSVEMIENFLILQ